MRKSFKIPQGRNLPVRKNEREKDAATATRTLHVRPGAAAVEIARGTRAGVSYISDGNRTDTCC